MECGVTVAQRDVSGRNQNTAQKIGNAARDKKDMYDRELYKR